MAITKNLLVPRESSLPGIEQLSAPFFAQARESRIAVQGGVFFFHGASLVAGAAQAASNQVDQAHSIMKFNRSFFTIPSLFASLLKLKKIVSNFLFGEQQKSRDFYEKEGVRLAKAVCNGVSSSAKTVSLIGSLGGALNGQTIESAERVSSVFSLFANSFSWINHVRRLRELPTDDLSCPSGQKILDREKKRLYAKLASDMTKFTKNGLSVANVAVHPFISFALSAV
jgi:hypothetical protein